MNAAASCLIEVAANGDVIYSGTGVNIYRWRSCFTLAPTAREPDDLWNTNPFTDGANVVFTKEAPCCSNRAHSIVIDDGSTQRVLRPAGTSAPLPGRDDAAAGGDVAHTAEDSSKSLQVWRHGPGGEQQLTVFGGSARIDAVLPDGTLLLAHLDKR
jgi:hypothetical protein